MATCLRNVAARLAIVALSALAMQACSLIWWPDDILPGDAVKTPDQAIARAIRSCVYPGAKTDRDHWDAHLEGGVWVVYWERDTRSVSARIEKADGSFDECAFSGQTDEE